MRRIKSPQYQFQQDDSQQEYRSNSYILNT